MDGKILRYDDLRAAGIPWTRVHLSRLEELGKFPRRVHLGEKTVGWLATEIDQFLAEKAAARRPRRAMDEPPPPCLPGQQTPPALLRKR